MAFSPFAKLNRFFPKKCVFNPWVVFISYWASLVVCMSALSLRVAGSIYELCTVVFWPASHSGGEDYSTHGRAFMMRARQARRPPDDVVILDNGASRTYLSVFKWLRNPVPCNGSVTSANGVRSRPTHIGSLGKLPTVLYNPDMAFNLLSQRDLEKGQLEFHYKEGVCSIFKKNIREPIMRIMVSDDNLYKMSYSDAEYLCNHLDTPSLVANLVLQDMTHYSDYKHDDMSTLIHGRLIHMHMETIRNAARHGHLKGLDKYLPKLSRQHFCRFCSDFGRYEPSQCLFVCVLRTQGEC